MESIAKHKSMEETLAEMGEILAKTPDPCEECTRERFCIVACKEANDYFNMKADIQEAKRYRFNS